MLKYTLLGFLGYGPLTGYDLKQRIDRSTTHFWHAKLSQIYITLKALEAEGCVTSQVEAQSERPDRRVYTITEAGRQALQAWLDAPYAELSPKKETLILKFFFSAQRQRASLLAELRLQRDLHRRQLDYYQHDTVAALRQAREEYPALEQDAVFWEATRRFGELYEELYVRWLDETIAQMEAPGGG